MSKTATKITKETPSIRLNIFHPISVSSFQKKKVSHPSLNLHAQHTVVEYTGGKLLIKRNATKCVSLLIIHELHATVSRWREKWSLSLPFTPTAFFILRWHWQANECFHLNTQTWLTVVWQPTIYVHLNSKKKKKKKKQRWKKFCSFFPSSQL